MEKWIFKKAKWYQFWLPGSGFIGGAIFGAVVILIIKIVENLNG